MADYQRILSYLYRYEKAEKKECTGFIKAEQKSGNLKLTIQIDDERLLQGMELQLCFYEKQGESWQIWQLDTLITQEHKEEMHLLYPAVILPTGFRIRGQSGVVLYYQDTFYYGSVWIGEEIPTETLNPLRWRKVANSAQADFRTERNHSAEEVPLQKETILEGNNTTNEENLKVEENPKKDFQGSPENGRNNQVLESILPDAKDSMAAGDKEALPDVKGSIVVGDKEALPNVKNSTVVQNEENIEENIEIKKVVAKVSELENKCGLGAEEKAEEIKTEQEEPEAESKTGPKQEEPESESKTGLKQEEPELELKTESEPEKIEPESKLKIKSTWEMEKKEDYSVDNFEKMWINSTKEKSSVDNIFNTAFYEGCRVSAADLVQLGEEAGELKSNQFLLKGYERYHHILAGKVRYAGEKRYCIGVPGIYENREKYMAEIYQFPVFLSLTENRMKTGSFGYWLHLLSKV